MVGKTRRNCVYDNFFLQIKPEIILILIQLRQNSKISFFLKWTYDKIELTSRPVIMSSDSGIISPVIMSSDSGLIHQVYRLLILDLIGKLERQSLEEHFRNVTKVKE